MKKDFYKKQFTTSEILEGLNDLIDESYKKDKIKRFSLEEFYFIKDLIDNRSAKNLIVNSLDHINNKIFSGFGLSNSAYMRRILFFRYFFINKGNATKSAIDAGYSPKSAKQQGYRVLKWIQKQSV